MRFSQVRLTTLCVFALLVLIVLIALAFVVLRPARIADDSKSGESQNSLPQLDNSLRSWLVLGPIPGEADDGPVTFETLEQSAYNADLLQQGGGERAIVPREGESVQSRAGDYTWTLCQNDGNAIDFRNALGGRDFAVGYAATVVDSPSEQTLLVGLGSDDAARVWINGELVHEHFTRRQVRRDEDLFAVTLRKGANQLLVKVLNDVDEWGFTFRFLSPSSQAHLLARAALDGDHRRVTRLLDAGVQADAKSFLGASAAQLAAMRGYDHIAKELVERGGVRPQTFDSSAVIEAIIKDMSASHLPGFAALVARDGTPLWQAGFGAANLSYNAPITTDSRFRIASVTKQFTACAILKLQEKGLLSVYDKLSKFIPDFPRGDEITIHHLLTHTSGITNYLVLPTFASVRTVGATHEDVIDSFKNEPLEFNPGEKYQYSNSGYYLLGIIVEHVSEQSLGEYLKETLFEPLGMHNTDIHHAQAIIEHEATGYTTVDGRLAKAIDWNMSRLGGAGVLYSTVGDLMLWNEAVFGGRVMSQQSMASAFTPVQLESDKQAVLRYGYGWMMGERRGQKTISHDGQIEGWRARVTRYPELKATVVVLQNITLPGGAFNPDYLAELIADAFLGAEMEPHPHFVLDESLDSEAFSDYVGRYAFRGLHEVALDIQLEYGQLTLQLPGQERTPLFFMGDDKFFWKSSDAHLECSRDSDGNVTAVRHCQNGIEMLAERLVEQP